MKWRGQRQGIPNITKGTVFTWSSVEQAFCLELIRAYLPTAEIMSLDIARLCVLFFFFFFDCYYKALLRLALASGHSRVHVMELLCFQSSNQKRIVLLFTLQFFPTYLLLTCGNLSKAWLHMSFYFDFHWRLENNEVIWLKKLGVVSG